MRTVAVPPAFALTAVGHKEERAQDDPIVLRCRYLAYVASSCGWSILMEKTTEAIAPLHPAVSRRGQIGRFAWPELPETLVRSSLVIVLDELVQQPRQMMPPEDH